MRRLLQLFAAGALALAVAASSNATTLPANGQTGIRVATLDPILIPATLSVTVNSSGGGDHLNSFTVPAGAFETVAFPLDVTDPGAAPIEGLLVTVQNGAGNFSGGAGDSRLNGNMALQGVVKVCLFADCTATIVPANLSVPVNNVGVGGTAFVASAVNITVIGAPWTEGTVNVATVTQMGMAKGPNNLTSTTALPAGVVNLVTPIFISTSIPSSAVVEGFGLLNINFAPEPGVLLLHGAAIAALALIGRSKLRK